MNKTSPGMSQNIDLRQSQQLIMTPQLQQAIKLLQLNNIELSAFVEEALEHNPLLEKDESSDSQPDNNEDPPDEPEKKEDVQGDVQEDFDQIENTSENDDFDAGSAMADIGKGGDTKFENTSDGFENRMAAEKTLREHLTEQLFIALDDTRDRMIGGLMIDMLDEAGYLREPPENIAQQLGCKPERVERLLKILKTFDPTGVFAADLGECLALQLEEQGQLDGPMKKLLENLDLLGNYDYDALVKICDVNETYIKDMVQEIQTLNPKPASDFEHIVVQTAIPDILMKRLPKNVGGGWRVELNNDTLPKVLINQEYYTEVSNMATQKKDKQYLENQMNAANWLVRALDQRAHTILKVAGAIIEEQDAFFNYGIEFLKPLTLKDIAEEIEMHESTVSRVTTNKYIGTPRGLFELKFFFSTALGGEDGGAVHSAEAVKARIKNLIDAENPKKILSDDKIVSLLNEEGIDIARRTVAKYRESMHIGSSVQRRKQKKNS